MSSVNHSKVAVIQLTASQDKNQNLANARTLMQGAVSEGVDLIVLPEHFNYIGMRDDVLEQVEDESGETLGFLKEFCIKNGVWVLGGSFFLKSEDSKKAYNTSFLIDSKGEVKAQYSKIHLFDIELSGDRAYRESGATKAGEAVVVADTPLGKAGLSICYDLRFPELYREQVAKGAEVLFVPAAFTVKTGRDHWMALLRARAIENQCFVVAAGQWGRHHANRETYGRSMVIDPWGTVIAQMGEGTGWITARLDRSYQKQVRSELPCLSHRKL